MQLLQRRMTVTVSPGSGRFGTPGGRGTPSGLSRCIFDYGNAVHAVRTQCEVLDVGKYSHPSYLLVVKH